MQEVKCDHFINHYVIINQMILMLCDVGLIGIIKVIHEFDLNKVSAMFALCRLLGSCCGLFCFIYGFV